MKTERRNVCFMVLVAALRSAAMLCATGTLLQTFLSALGFSEDQIYIHSSLLQAANVISILLSARWADSGDLIRRAALIQLPFAVLFLCYLPLCLWKDASMQAYLLLLAVGAVQSALAGLYTVCDYKMPYCAFTEKGFGILLSASGLASSLTTLGVGMLVTYLTERISYITLMTWGFAISCLAVLLSALLQGCMRPVGSLPDFSAVKKSAVPLKAVLLAPVFRNMIPANLCRGFAMGAFTVMPVMALSMGYGETVAAAMVSVQSAAMIIGSLLFGVLSRYLRPRTVILAGSVCLASALLMLIRGEYLFLAAYATVSLGKLLVDNAVPAALRHTVPSTVAGPYNAWRMILHNIGTILGTLAAAWMPVSGVLALAVAGQLFSGWSYYRAKVMKQ